MPNVSVLMPVFNTQEEYLRASIESILNSLKEYVLNPGCVYRLGKVVFFNVIARSVRDIIKNPPPLCALDKIVSCYPKDKVVELDSFFHKKLVCVLETEAKIILKFFGIKITLKKRRG